MLPAASARRQSHPILLGYPPTLAPAPPRAASHTRHHAAACATAAPRTLDRTGSADGTAPARCHRTSSAARALLRLRAAVPSAHAALACSSLAASLATRGRLHAEQRWSAVAQDWPLRVLAFQHPPRGHALSATCLPRSNDRPGPHAPQLPPAHHRSPSQPGDSCTPSDACTPAMRARRYVRAAHGYAARRRRNSVAVLPPLPTGLRYRWDA